MKVRKVSEMLLVVVGHSVSLLKILHTHIGALLNDVFDMVERINEKRASIVSIGLPLSSIASESEIKVLDKYKDILSQCDQILNVTHPNSTFQLLLSNFVDNCLRKFLTRRYAGSHHMGDVQYYNINDWVEVFIYYIMHHEACYVLWHSGDIDGLSCIFSSWLLSDVDNPCMECLKLLYADAK